MLLWYGGIYILLHIPTLKLLQMGEKNVLYISHHLKYAVKIDVVMLPSQQTLMKSYF